MEYETGARWVGGITWIVTFLGTWAWCAVNYGFLLGFGLGWLPALILAFIAGMIAGLLWPVVVLGLLGLGVWIYVAIG